MNTGCPLIIVSWQGQAGIKVVGQWSDMGFTVIRRCASVWRAFGRV
jgi:hypothetical protein